MRSYYRSNWVSRLSKQIENSVGKNIWKSKKFSRSPKFLIFQTFDISLNYQAQLLRIFMIMFEYCLLFIPEFWQST